MQVIEGQDPRSSVAGELDAPARSTAAAVPMPTGDEGSSLAAAQAATKLTVLWRAGDWHRPLLV
jgi:hypothetical protein